MYTVVNGELEYRVGYEFISCFMYKEKSSFGTGRIGNSRSCISRCEFRIVVAASLHVVEPSCVMDGQY